MRSSGVAVEATRCRGIEGSFPSAALLCDYAVIDSFFGIGRGSVLPTNATRQKRPGVLCPPQAQATASRSSGRYGRQTPSIFLLGLSRVRHMPASERILNTSRCAEFTKWDSGRRIQSLPARQPLSKPQP